MVERGLLLMNTNEFAATMMKLIVKDKNIDKKKYLMCKLGLETLIINITKGIIVYMIAFMLEILLEVFIFHMSYAILRSYAFGVHSSNSLFCTIFSTVTLVGTPWLLKKYYLDIKWLFIFMIINILLVIIYAPIGTKKYIIKNERKKILKRKSVIVLLVYNVLLFTSIGIDYKNLVVMGAFLEVIMILPITYKFIN